MFFSTAGSLGGGKGGLHASEDHSMSGKVSTWQQEQTEVFELWPPPKTIRTKKRGNDNVITRSQRRCPESTIGTWLFSGMALWCGTRCWILEVLTRDKLPCSWSRFVRHWRSCSSAFGMGIGIWGLPYLFGKKLPTRIVGRICPTSTFIRQTAVCENMCSILCDLTLSPPSQKYHPSLGIKLLLQYLQAYVWNLAVSLHMSKINIPQSHSLCRFWWMVKKPFFFHDSEVCPHIHVITLSKFVVQVLLEKHFKILSFSTSISHTMTSTSPKSDVFLPMIS